MKRIALLITSALLCFSMNAQIQRKFFGCTLGESKINEVEHTLKKADISFEKGRENIEATSVEFGGYAWDKVVFHFYEKKLYEIFFYCRDYMGLRKSHIAKRIESIGKTLEDKYLNFMVKKDDEGYLFSDDKTSLNLKNGESIIVLGYVDKRIMSIKTDREKDEF